VFDVVKPDNSGPVGGIALGNIFGSNVANIGLILGLTALVRAVPTTESKLRFEACWMVLASVLCMKPLLLQGSFTVLDGAVLVGLLGLFTIMLLRRERGKASDKGNGDNEPGDHDGGRAALHVALVVLGLLGLFYGGQWLVSGAKGVARDLLMPESVIGATIVAVGTSLPELVTALVAARRGHPEIAVGNVVGSNIFNVFMVLGVCALVRPLPVTFAEHGMRMSVGLVLAVTLGILLMGRPRISRRAGAVLSVCYLAYLTAEVARL